MIKKVVCLSIVSIFTFSALGAYADRNTLQPTAAQPMEKTKDRASRAMNNILLGPMEVPQNIDETKTKGTQMDKCSKKTRSGVERGIARITTGIWQLATFWYSDPGCVTSSTQSSQSGKTASEVK